MTKCCFFLFASKKAVKFQLFSNQLPTNRINWRIAKGLVLREDVEKFVFLLLHETTLTTTTTTQFIYPHVKKIAMPSRIC